MDGRSVDPNLPLNAFLLSKRNALAERILPDLGTIAPGPEVATVKLGLVAPFTQLEEGDRLDMFQRLRRVMVEADRPLEDAGIVPGLRVWTSPSNGRILPRRSSALLTDEIFQQLAIFDVVDILAASIKRLYEALGIQPTPSADEWIRALETAAQSLHEGDLEGE